MRYIITIDQRTSSSKALLFDEKLNLIDHKIIPHKISHPRQDWVEADAEEIYALCCGTRIPASPSIPQ